MEKVIISETRETKSYSYSNDKEKEVYFTWIRYTLFLIFGLYIVFIIAEMEKNSSPLTNETKSNGTAGIFVIIMGILITLDFLHERLRFDLIPFKAKEILFSLSLIVIGLFNKDIRSETWFFGICLMSTMILKRVFETLQYISKHSCWKTIHISKVPKWMRHEFVLSGYRPKMSSYTKALFSIFRLHNQSGNIWSHLIGTAYFTAIAFKFFSYQVCEISIQDLQVWIE